MDKMSESSGEKSLSSLKPVQLPQDIQLVQTVDRETLRAKLRAKTNALSSHRQRKPTQTKQRVDQAIDSLATSTDSTIAQAAQTQGSAAHTLIKSMDSERLADMVQSVINGGQMPEQLRQLIPPEARNLSRKDLVKVLKRMQLSK